MPVDQIMAEGGLFLVIEWTIFWQKGRADKILDFGYTINHVF
ncbi:hypothetical protein NBRC111894_1121 [Sporolactobacillus inulinus]|uniref:Uncharacterized protein n=1 Tax=Sporolactobacillus inulinus TaxID=2078 RepID=A0A4Y1Z934_9BACL|nr:hypothetical protein NBRC111894_1121 [Sporolactobacillus inulinus]